MKSKYQQIYAALLSLLGLPRVFEEVESAGTLYYLTDLRQVAALFKVVRVRRCKNTL